MNKRISKNMLKHNKHLNKYACYDSNAIRFREETKPDIRPPFFRDIDRIIHSLAYTRYIDKTQVFSLNANSNISKRIIHVQLVSKIARTIGRALNLNEDLIEAIALGHDIGHVPFGHVGESILNEISLKNNEGYFNHNVESVRDLMFIEHDGKGNNLTLQVLDGIMCHNGELNFIKYVPQKKDKEKFMEEYKNCYSDKEAISKLIPMTLEGCVVRISDIIAYIGRDIEDAIMLGVLKKNQLPSEIIKYLGQSNKEIVNKLTLDVIENSYNKPYISMSEKTFNILMKLKAFNYQEIYLKANTKEQIDFYKKMFNVVFEECLKDLKSSKKHSRIYKLFISKMSKKYLKSTTNERIVIDYISGMTDDFLISEYEFIITNIKDNS